MMLIKPKSDRLTKAEAEKASALVPEVVKLLSDESGAVSAITLIECLVELYAANPAVINREMDRHGFAEFIKRALLRSCEEVDKQAGRGGSGLIITGRLY
jgi:hypothetical protein